MAIRFEGGRAVNISINAVDADKVRRIQWIRQRERRLKDQLRAGEVDAAQFTMREILETAKPGDLNHLKADGMNNAINNALKALNVARAAYSGSLIAE